MILIRFSQTLFACPILRRSCHGASKPDFNYQSVPEAHSACGKTPESHSYHLCASVDRNTTLVRSPIVPLSRCNERTFVREHSPDHGTDLPCRGHCGGLASFSILDSIVVISESFSFCAMRLMMRCFDEDVAQPRASCFCNAPMTNFST